MVVILTINLITAAIL